MSFRAAHIGLAVALSLIGIGVVAVGGDPSDAELHAIIWPAAVIGLLVLLLVDPPRTRCGRR